MKCPKCGYERKPEDTLVPHYECPACGIVYAKYTMKLAEGQRIRDEMQRHRKEQETVQIGPAPTPERRSGCLSAFGYLIMALVFFMIIGALLNPDRGQNYDSTSGDPVYNSAYDGSVWQVEKWMKSRESILKDPDSFQAIDWSQVKKDAESGGYAVRCKYRARNGFGGYTIENRLFGLDRQGNITGSLLIPEIR